MAAPPGNSAARAASHFKLPGQDLSCLAMRTLSDCPHVTRRNRLVLLIALVLVPCALLLAWMVRAQTAAAPADEAPRRPAAAIPVVLALATEATNAAEIDVLGSGLAARSVTLFPAVAGEVMQLSFKAGQRVQAQEVLMRLDDRNQKLAINLAAAKLDAAERLRARYEATRGTGAVPGSVIDEAQAGVNLARIELQQAREALADRVLRAPFAGVVGLAEVEAGDRVTLDTAITTLDDRRSLQVAFELPEVYAARLKPGQLVTVNNPAFGERRFEGRIAQIDSRVNDASRNLRLRATVLNPEDLLRPGMSFQVRLTLPGERFVAVPELALQRGREGAFVWVIRDGKAVQVPVRSVRRADARVLIEGAVRVGEQVVVEGVQRLRDGSTVAAVAASPARAAALAAPGASAGRSAAP